MHTLTGGDYWYACLLGFRRCLKWQPLQHMSCQTRPEVCHADYNGSRGQGNCRKGKEGWQKCDTSEILDRDRPVCAASDSIYRRQVRLTMHVREQDWDTKNARCAFWGHLFGMQWHQDHGRGLRAIHTSCNLYRGRAVSVRERGALQEWMQTVEGCGA